MRNFRLGEWLPEPVTPLFETWFLPRVEARLAADQVQDAGFAVPPPMHVVVNGWYFHSPFGAASPRIMIGGFMRRPRFGLGSIALRFAPQLSDRLIARPLTQRWRQSVLPSYTRLVDAGQDRVEVCSTPELTNLVDEITDAAGRYLWSIVMVAGFAWKAEAVLARFCRRHLRSVLPAGHQPLLCSLGPPPPAAPPYSVHSIDWVRPTLGETDLGTGTGNSDPNARWSGQVAQRTQLEAACRGVLGRQRQKRFDMLLDLVQRYGRLREEQVSSFTLAWPLLRRAVLRLGEEACSRGVIATPDDVFFLTRRELADGEDFVAHVPPRRLLWEQQRRLVPPLMVGELPSFLRHVMVNEVESMRAPGSAPAAGTIVGQPASPGRAVGPVRVVRDAADLGPGSLQTGDVLVVPIMAPAWTPLFGQVAAVVSDGGSLAAHASLIAREYGIPAVVATGDATQQLSNGQVVVVDGGRGTVERVCS